MITSALLSILAKVILIPAFILPEGSLLPSNFVDLMTSLVSYAYAWDWILPIGTVFAVFTAIITFFLAEIGWKIGRYFISLIRGN